MRLQILNIRWTQVCDANALFATSPDICLGRTQSRVRGVKIKRSVSADKIRASDILEQIKRGGFGFAQQRAQAGDRLVDASP